MKVRLRRPVEGLEVDTIYELYLDDRVFRFNDPSVPATRYVTIADLFEFFEVLQPVSDTTKQAIRLQLEHLQRLQTDLTWRWRTNDEMTHEQHEQEWDDIKDQQWEAIVSVLEGKE